MRENSGNGDAGTNTQDPTLKDHEGNGGPGERKGDFTEGAPFNVAGNTEETNENASPSDRRRGEVSGNDAASPIDQNR